MSAPLPSIPAYATQGMPQNIELEKCLVSSVMQDEDVLADVIEIVPDSEMLFHAGAREIYRAVLEMNAKGEARDLQLITQYLYINGRIKDAGGMEGVAEIFACSPTKVHARYYAVKVRDTWMLRRLIYLGTDLARNASEFAGDANDIRADHEREIFALGDVGHESKVESSAQISHQVMDLIDAYGRNEKLGISFGFIDVDNIFCGMEPKSVTVLAGRPGGGKSKLAGNVIVNAAQNGVPVMLYSLEMTNREIGLRIACSLSSIDHFRLVHNQLTPKERIRLNDACNELGKLPIHWQDTPGMRPSELLASLRRMKRKHNIQLAVIDHMLLMQPDNRSHRSRNDEVGEISRMLKLAAKEVDIPILALCQMNRSVEGRSDDTPRLSDLRDSGNIEQDADNVIFLHRKAVGDGLSQPDTVDLHIAKQRNGPQGKVTLLDRANCYRFENWHRGLPQ